MITVMSFPSGDPHAHNLVWVDGYAYKSYPLRNITSPYWFSSFIVGCHIIKLYITTVNFLDTVYGFPLYTQFHHLFRFTLLEIANKS